METNEEKRRIEEEAEIPQEVHIIRGGIGNDLICHDF